MERAAGGRSHGRRGIALQHDAFTAALALVWRDRPPAEALEFANAAGAAAATVFGAQPSMPGPDTVRAMMQRKHREG